MALFRESGCNRVKWLSSGIVVVFGKLVVIGKSCCFRAKVVVFGKVVVFVQKWLYSGKVVVFGQSGSIRAKWLYSGKGG